MIYYNQGKGKQPKQRKGEKKMRTIIYAIIEKETGKRVYANCRMSKCEEVLATMENKENYKIGYKWFSI